MSTCLFRGHYVYPLGRRIQDDFASRLHNNAYVIDVITGVGNAANLELDGRVELLGQINATSLKLSNGTAAQVTLDSSSSLDVAGGAQGGGTFTLNSGSHLGIGGDLQGSTWTLSGGSNVEIGGNVSRSTFNLSGGSTAQVGTANYVSASVSDTSSLEFGSAGGAAAGSVTIDAGQSLTVGWVGWPQWRLGNFSAPLIVNNGTVNVSDNTWDWLNWGGTQKITNNGTINVIGWGALFGLSSAEYVDNGTINVGSAPNVLSISATLAKLNGTVNVTDGSSYSVSGTTLTNDGTITANSGNIGVNGAFTNNNSITVNYGSFFSTGAFTENGTLSIAHGTATINGELSGTGSLSIGDGGTMFLHGTVASGAQDAIYFTGGNGVLSLDTSDFDANKVFAPLITGFDSNDALDVQGTVTSASASGHTLTLKNGTDVVGQISLAGDYSGVQFLAVGLGNGYTQITEAGVGDTVTAPTGTSVHTYQWNSVAGSWDSGNNWIDSTVSQTPASQAPGAQDNVVVNNNNVSG